MGWGEEGDLIIPSQAGVQKMGPNLVWEAVRWGWLDVGNEGRVSDVLVITDDMHSVLPRLRGPVPHVTGAISLVITFDFGLRGSLNGEAWVRGGEGQRAPEAAWTQSFPQQPLAVVPCPSPCLIPTLPSVPHRHLPNVPTSVPMASTTKSADLPTWPVSKPGPQARTFCAPASGLTCTSKGLGEGGAGVNTGKYLAELPLLCSLHL